MAGEELDESEEAIFGILVNQLNESYAEAYAYRSQVGGVDAAKVLAWDFAGFLYQHPSARALWNRREDNLEVFRGLLKKSPYKAPWTETVRNSLAELDRVEPRVDKKLFVDF